MKTHHMCWSEVASKTVCICLSSLVVLLLSLAPGSTARAVSLEKYPQLIELADRLVQEHDLDRTQLLEWFEQAQIKEKIIKAMNRPAERLSWHRYRGLFVNERSVGNGVKFAKRHRVLLDRAEARFGIPIEVIVAIIGIETRYGKVTGNLRVLDSLATLALEYPRRSKFFSSELEHYMLLVRDNKLDPLVVKGSYAGAMGISQFMPSSYRRYAIDFDGDERSDLLNSVADAIGSVANYLAVHRWRKGEPIALRIPVEQAVQLEPFVTRGLKPNTPLATLIQAGMKPIPGVDLNWNVGVMQFDQENEVEYRLGYHNFFVITRYNRSQNYAMSAFELAEQIAARIKD